LERNYSKAVGASSENLCSKLIIYVAAVEAIREKKKDRVKLRRRRPSKWFPELNFRVT
jgi:hypothetical protein